MSSPSRFTIKVLSDIHLELRRYIPLQVKQYLTKKSSYPTIVGLCGDIGDPHTPLYRNIISLASNNNDHVIIVAGNHEYYNSIKNKICPITMDEIKDKILDITKSFQNVTFLDNNKLYLYNHKLLGTTLWSKIHNIEHISKAITDYNMIYINNTNIIPKHTNEFHTIATTWIEKELIEQIRNPRIYTSQSTTNFTPYTSCTSKILQYQTQ